MLEREGSWLLQLRDDINGIVHPGCWALFGGHLDPGESASEALQRELIEEINWVAPQLPPWFVHCEEQKQAHFFRGQLTVPLDQLTLLEGQDMVLASTQELLSGRIWSPKRQEFRPLAPSLQWAVQQLQLEENNQTDH